MKKWILLLVFLPLSLRAADSPPKFSSAAWQIAVSEIFFANFSYDNAVENNTAIGFLDSPRIIAESRSMTLNGNTVTVIYLSRGFTDLIATQDELLFFLAHEIGHSKMDSADGPCGLCGTGCREIAADQFAIDFLESKGRNSCGGKALLLKMILQAGSDPNEERLKQLREHCPGSIAAP